MWYAHLSGPIDTSESVQAPSGWYLLSPTLSNCSEQPRGLRCHTLACWVHICVKLDSEDRFMALIQTEYSYSGASRIFIFIVLSSRAVVSFCIFSSLPGYIVNMTRQHGVGIQVQQMVHWECDLIIRILLLTLISQ